MRKSGSWIHICGSKLCSLKKDTSVMCSIEFVNSEFGARSVEYFGFRFIFAYKTSVL